MKNIVYVRKENFFRGNMQKTISTLFFNLIFSTCFTSPCSHECFAAPLKQSSFDDRTLLLSTHTNSFLAEKIANYLGISLATSAIITDSKGKIHVTLEENVRNKNVLILPSYQRSNSYINDRLFELYLFVRETKRASASSITAIIPYHEHQNRYIKSSSISSSDISLFLEVTGVDRIITLDLNSGHIQGFFRNIPTDNLYTAPMFVPYFADKDLNNVVVASLDIESEEKARKFAESLEYYGVSAEVVLVNQEISQIENIKGADVILLDEICGTAHSLVQAANLLQQQGARRVFAVVIHPIFTDQALEMIGKSNIEEMVIPDTLSLKETLPSNIRFIPVQRLFSSVTTNPLPDDSLLDWLP